LLYLYRVVHLMTTLLQMVKKGLTDA
jgi:hypothetical protein